MSCVCPECSEDKKSNWCDECNCETIHGCETEINGRKAFYGDKDWLIDIFIHYCPECGDIQDITYGK